VITDASALASTTKGQTHQLAMDAIAAKVAMNAANAKIIALAKVAKQVVDHNEIQVVANATSAAKVVVETAADSHTLSQAVVEYLIQRNASLQ
jgi:acetylglutamate kinase